MIRCLGVGSPLAATCKGAAFAPSLGIERKPEDMGLGLHLAIERLEVIKDGIGLWNFLRLGFGNLLLGEVAQFIEFGRDRLRGGQLIVRIAFLSDELATHFGGA